MVSNLLFLRLKIAPRSSWLLLLLFWGPFLLAQDTHYWTQQYGARSSLLGGAVIHGLDDNSAVYYNPANLAFIKQTTISLNTSIYKYEDFSVWDGAGDGVDLKSQRISLYQNMISGLITKNPEKRYRIGFNILTRNHVNFDFKKKNELFYEIIPNQAGQEYYIGNIEMNTTLSDTWGCIGGSYRISDHFSVGLTAIVSYRNQKHTLAFSGRALNAPDSAALAGGASIFIASNSYDFHMRSNIISGLLKAGFHGRIGPWRFGLNITSPSLTIWGEGRVEREESQNNLPGNVDRVRTDEQRNLWATYRYPFAVGTGVAYLYKTGLISLAAEYFMGIQQYEMIQADPSDPTFPIYLSSGVEKYLTVYNGAQQVLNFGIGWEQEITPKVKLHLGLRTDFSYVPLNQEPRLTVTSAPMDIYHIALGLSFRRKASKISFGVNYSYAQQRISQLVNLSDPVVDASQNLFLFGYTKSNAFITAHSATILVGYTYFFALK